MKEIIINPDMIKNDEITDKRIINNYIFINEGKVLLKKHHNSYYFIHDDDLNNKYNSKLFLIKKVYDLDYPFIGDKCLTINNYYLVKDNIMIDSTEWLDINKIIIFLDNQRYNNPRVQNITDEIIEVLNYLFTNKNISAN